MPITPITPPPSGGSMELDQQVLDLADLFVADQALTNHVGSLAASVRNTALAEAAHARSVAAGLPVPPEDSGDTTGDSGTTGGTYDGEDLSPLAGTLTSVATALDDFAAFLGTPDSYGGFSWAWTTFLGHTDRMVWNFLSFIGMAAAAAGIREGATPSGDPAQHVRDVWKSVMETAQDGISEGHFAALAEELSALNETITSCSGAIEGTQNSYQTALNSHVANLQPHRDALAATVSYEQSAYGSTMFEYAMKDAGGAGGGSGFLIDEVMRYSMNQYPAGSLVPPAEIMTNMMAYAKAMSVWQNFEDDHLAPFYRRVLSAQAKTVLGI